MLKRLLTLLLAATVLLSCIYMVVSADENGGDRLAGNSLSINTTYILENTGASDASVTFLGSVSRNVRADWVILNADGTMKSHGNFAHICFLSDLDYILSPGERMILKPIQDHYGNDEIQVFWDSSITVRTTSVEPVYRYFLRKGASYCFSNETDATQYFYFSGEANQGIYASANVYADYLHVDSNQNILSIGCGNSLSMLDNVRVTLKPGEKYTVCPRKDQNSSKDYIVAYTLNYGMPCDVTLSDQQPNPIRRIKLLKGYEYSIANLTENSLPVYFSGQWNGYDVSANIRADISVYENGTLVSKAVNKLLSTTTNSRYSIGANQTFEIAPISDYYSSKDYIVAFVPYTIDETELSVSIPVKSRYDEETDQISLRVYQNENDSKDRFDSYVLSDNAAVSYNEMTCYTTDGIALIPNIQTGAISVSKEDYITRTLTAKQLQNSQNIYLQQKSTEAPVVSAVWVNDFDVLNEDYGVEILSKEETTLTAEVDWSSSSYGSISLVQDARSVKFSGDTLTTVLSDHFDVSETIYIVATDEAGNATKKALKFESGSASNLPAVLDGAKFSLTDKISITLPDNFKPDFFAGQKISAALSADIPITLSFDNGKVYFAIGADLIKYSETKKISENTNKVTVEQEIKYFTQMFKDSLKKASDSIDKFKKIKQTYKNVISHPKGTFGFEADFTVLGFAEGYVNQQGQLIFLDSGIIFNPSISVSKNLPFALGPVPMYFEASLSADIQAQMNLKFNEIAKNFTPNGEISGTITLSGGVCAGIKKVLYAGGGLEGKLTPDWRIYRDAQDYFKLTASLNAYAKTGILFFEYKHTWDPIYNAVWIEYPKSKSAMASLQFADIYDTANYVTKDLNYLNDASDFSANSSGAPLLMSSQPNDGYKSVLPMKTNIYHESTPQLVSFSDGTALSVWLDSDNSDINGIVLYYSYYDGVSWSDPKPVCLDGTMDYTPQLHEINDTAYLVWQNATKEFSTTDTLESTAAFFDISVATFDPESGFNVFTIDNEGLDMLPVVCGDANARYVVWLHNGENDWFGNNRANNILYSVNNGGEWSEPVIVYSNLNSIDGIAADYDGSLNVAYCMDGDGNINTTEDVRLYENGKRVTASETSEANPQYVNHVLHCNSNGMIWSQTKSSREMPIGAGNYQILSGSDGDILVYTTSDGLSSILHVSYYNPETQEWCEPYELLNQGTFIGAFSAAINENGTLQVLLNSQEVTGTYIDDDPYGAATLELVTLKPYCDLNIGELIYSSDQYSAGDAMEIAFDLTNNGSQTIHSATITTVDAAGSILSSIVLDETIVPGQTITASTYFLIDDAATGHQITITVTPDALKDINTSDNSQSESLVFEDLGVEQCTFGRRADGKVVISADVVNYGYHVRSNISVELREGGAEGKVVASTELTALDPLGLDTVSFVLLSQDADVYYVIIRESEDIFTENDSDFTVVPAVGEQPIILIDSVTADEAHIYLSNKMAGTCFVAIYNTEGKMLTVGSTQVSANAGDTLVSYPVFSSSQYDAKVFFVDESYTPIYSSVKGKN